jgi:alpha-beta hydrolase superfamily lysophospholipase
VNFFSFLLLILLSNHFLAQGVGQISVNFKDPSRTGGFSDGGLIFPAGETGRDIETEIYYPATSNGVNQPIVPGDYPVVVFGHGFQMVWSAYENIWTALVAEGYIVAFPRTEGGLSPTHADFGADLALVEVLIQQMGATAGNILEGNVAPAGAIMGHSMGGGSSFLAGGNNNSTTLRTIIGLAPAETNPSAIAAAGNLSVDVLVLSGSSDGVTPPAEHHIPIYDAASSVCKYFVSLTGAGHCRFANDNFQCNLGETFSGGAGAMPRAQVHEIMNSLVIPWLDHYLKAEPSAWTSFENVLSIETNIVVTNGCQLSINENNPLISARLYPNPTSSNVVIEFTNDFTGQIRITDQLGRIIKNVELNQQNIIEMDVNDLPAGKYHVQLVSSHGFNQYPLIIQH